MSKELENCLSAYTEPERVLAFKILAQHTAQKETVDEIFEEVWTNLNVDGKYYERIIKTLMVIEYLLVNGSMHCVQEVHKGLYKIRTLETFSYVSKGSEKATKIREISKKICLLLSDAELLQQERLGAEHVQSMQKNRIYGINASTAIVPEKRSSITTSIIIPHEVKKDNDMSEAEDYMRKRQKRLEMIKPSKSCIVDQINKVTGGSPNNPFTESIRQAIDTKRSCSLKGWESFEFNTPKEEAKAKQNSSEKKGAAPSQPLIDFTDPFEYHSKTKNEQQLDYSVYLDMLKDLDFTAPTVPQVHAEDPPTARTIYYTANKP